MCKVREVKPRWGRSRALQELMILVKDDIDEQMG